MEKAKSPRKVPRKKKAVKTRYLPQYNIILHNDNINTANDVVDRVMSIIPYFRGKEGEIVAIECVEEAHENGQSFLGKPPITVHKERAEFYVAQFAACRPSIKVTAAPVHM